MTTTVFSLLCVSEVNVCEWILKLNSPWKIYIFLINFDTFITVMLTCSKWVLESIMNKHTRKIPSVRVSIYSANACLLSGSWISIVSAGCWKKMDGLWLVLAEICSVNILTHFWVKEHKEKKDYFLWILNWNWNRFFCSLFNLPLLILRCVIPVVLGQ